MAGERESEWAFQALGSRFSLALSCNNEVTLDIIFNLSCVSLSSSIKREQ